MSFINVVFNETLEFPMSEETVKMLPYFADKEPVNGMIHVTCPIALQHRHPMMISKILNKKSIAPMIDATSHRDVLTVINLAKFFGISNDVVSEGFAGWTDSNKWMKLRGAEYMYLVFLANEDLVDFKKYFRNVKGNSMEMVKNAAELHEVRSCPEVYIDMLLFFKNFDYATCFDHNNDKVHAHIANLKKERSSAWEVFLVNVHEPFMAGYFRRVIPTLTSEIWDCEKISSVKNPGEGEPVISDFAGCREKFTDFTVGLIEKSINASVTTPFPYDIVAFAGGSIAKLVSVGYNPKNARQSDVDMFVLGKNTEERTKNCETLLNWFKTYSVGLVAGIAGDLSPAKQVITTRTYYAMRGSVTTIYIKDIARKFQLISINHANSYEVLERFDLTHIQWCYWRGQFLATPEGCRSMCDKMARFNNSHRLRTNRLIKALHCGYNIMKTADIVEKFIDITNLLADVDSMQTQKYIRDLYSWYYPRSDPEMDEADEHMHFLSMIEKDSNASLVTIDPNYVSNNFVVGGNFESDYEAVLFNTFNPAVVANRVQAARIQKVALRSKFGTIRLTTGIMKIVKVCAGEAGLEITLHSDDEAFKEFCGVLEGNVYHMFRPGAVSRHLLDDNSNIKFVLHRYQIDKQNIRGVSCLRNQRGASLDIEEDLNVGDELQVLFAISMIMYPEDRAVELLPIKFIKYVTTEEGTNTDTVESIPEEETDTLTEDIELEYCDTEDMVEEQVKIVAEVMKQKEVDENGRTKKAGKTGKIVKGRKT